MAQHIANSPGSDVLSSPSQFNVGDSILFNWSTNELVWQPLKKGLYKIKAAGGRAGSPGHTTSITGTGAIVEGYIELGAEDILNLRPGGQGKGGSGGQGGSGSSTEGGVGYTGSNGGTGGAGSFVKYMGNVILAAGGGGGDGGKGGSGRNSSGSTANATTVFYGGKGGTTAASDQTSNGGAGAYNAGAGTKGAAGSTPYDGYGAGGGGGGRGERFVFTAGQSGYGGKGGANYINTLIIDNSTVFSPTNGGNGYIEITYIEPRITNKYLFQDGEEIKKYWKFNFIQVTDGTAASSSFYNNPPANAFDGLDTTAWVANTSPTVASPQWLEYALSGSKIIEKYSIMPQNHLTYGPDRAPKDFTFEGYNGTSWVVLDTQSNIADWSTGVKKEFDISNSTSYPKYRIKVTANNGDSSYLSVGELELYEKTYGWSIISAAPATKEMFDTHGMTDLSLVTNEAIQGLVSASPELLCWTDEEGDTVSRTANLTAIPHPQLLLPIGDIEVGEVESVKVDAKAYSGYTEDLCVGGIPITNSNTTQAKAFDNDASTFWGTSESGQNAVGKYIGYDFGTENKKHIRRIGILENSAAFHGTTAKVQYSHDKNLWTDVATLTLLTDYTKLNFYDLPPSAVARYWRIMLDSTSSANVWIINEIEMYEFLQGNADLKIIASPDSGITWKGKSPVNSTDLTAVKAYGFTPEEFNALTKEELAALFPSGKARFAFYLEQEKSTDIVEVQSLSINEMQYTMTPSLESASVIYEMLKTEQPKIFVSRNDGVNWTEIEPDKLIDLASLPAGNQLRVKFELASGQEIHAYSYSWV